MIRVMMMLFLAATFFTSTAQEISKYPKPDYADIEKLTKDRSSAFYYTALYQKYQNNDTTLTPRDYWMLYYGYYFTDGYSPFKNTEYSANIMQTLNKQAITDADWKNISENSKLNLQANPFDLKGLNIAWIAKRQLGDTVGAHVYFVKLKNLVEVILSTGDGLTESTAFHVQDAAHEFDILNILGYEFGGDHNLTSDNGDYLTLKDNEHNLAGLFFAPGKDVDEYLRVTQATMRE